MTATNPQAPVIGSKNVTGLDVPGSRAKVFFTPVIDAEHLFKLYRRVNLRPHRDQAPHGRKERPQYSSARPRA